MHNGVTVDDVFRAAYELTTGNGRPNLLYALWGAILSPQKPIEMNCAQAAVLRPFVKSGLPTENPEELARYITERAGGWVYGNHAQAIIRVDGLYRAGLLAHLECEPQTAREWIRWRQEIAHLWGLGWKTASFAALILWPFSTPFVPVDSHVCDMLGCMEEYRKGQLSKKSRPGYLRYRRREREWRAVVSRVTSVVSVGHWFYWASHESGEVKSHALLNAVM